MARNAARKKEESGASKVADTVQIGQTPGAPNVGQQPRPGETRVLTADPRKEYIAGVSLGATWYLNLARSLPAHIDDLTEEVGDDVYARMMADPQIAASINVFKAAVLETGPQFDAALEDQDDPDYPKAVFIADWCEKIFGDLATSMDDILWNLADAFFLGNKVAELIYTYSDRYWALPAHKPKPRPGQPPPKPIPVGRPKLGSGPQLVLTDIKVKPRRSVGFLVDAFMNVLGILGHIPGNYYPIMPGMVYASIDQIPNLLPADKFAILTFRPRDADPRGTSMLRPAYNAWYIKEQLWAEYGKFLSQMAGGLLVGQPSPEAQPLQIQHPDGSPTGQVATPAEALLQTLLNARNGAVIVTEAGSAVQVHYPVGDGSAFLEGFQLLNLEITKGILHVTLATEEGKHQARAAAEVHADVLAILIRTAKGSVERLIRDICRRLIVANYGDDAERFVPRVGLGELESADQSKLWTALAALMTAAYFTPDQLPQVDAMAGLPVRLPPDEDDAAQDVPAQGASPDQAAASGRDVSGRADPMHPEDQPTPAGAGQSVRPASAQRRKEIA